MYQVGVIDPQSNQSGIESGIIPSDEDLFNRPQSNQSGIERG